MIIHPEEFRNDSPREGSGNFKPKKKTLKHLKEAKALEFCAFFFFWGGMRKNRCKFPSNQKSPNPLPRFFWRWRTMMSRWAGLTITLESCWIKQSRTTFIHIIWYKMIIWLWSYRIVHRLQPWKCYIDLRCDNLRQLSTLCELAGHIEIAVQDLRI